LRTCCATRSEISAVSSALVPSGVRILLNGKKVGLSALAAGQKITVVGTRIDATYTAAKVQATGKVKPAPSSSPSVTPTTPETPSPSPSATEPPSTSPTVDPSVDPSATPSVTPTVDPSDSADPQPTEAPEA
jgi:hypothetical protein